MRRLTVVPDGASNAFPRYVPACQSTVVPGNLPSAETKPIAVQEMFDRIAPRYDRMNRLLTGGMDVRWRKRAVRLLRIAPPDVVLDLACGTGDFSRMAAANGARVVGLDFSRQMLLAGAQPRSSVEQVVQGDALRLPFADGSFDVALCGFALRNFAAIPPVLAEVARVLKPGGRFGVIEVDRPRSAIVRGAHGIYFNRVVPLVGGLLSDRRAYRYLPESVTYLPPAEELAAMFSAAGFVRFRKDSQMMGAIQSLFAVKG